MELHVFLNNFCHHDWKYPFNMEQYLCYPPKIAQFYDGWVYFIGSDQANRRYDA